MHGPMRAGFGVEPFLRALQEATDAAKAAGFGGGSAEPMDTGS